MCDFSAEYPVERGNLEANTTRQYIVKLIKVVIVERLLVR